MKAKHSCVAALLLGSLAFTPQVWAVDATTQPRPSIIMPKADTAPLVDIARAGDRLVTVGEKGHILLSDDGKNWRQVVAPVSRMLTKVFFLNDTTGWAIGYDAAILKTTDAGETWTLQHFNPDPGWPFYGIYFINESTGWVMGERGTFLRSDDGGESWNEVETPVAELGMHLNGMMTLGKTESGEDCLFMYGEKGVMARSGDGGNTWHLITTPYVGSWFGALPHKEHGVILFGLRGNVYATDDISTLPTEDPYEWDEYGRESVTDAAQLAEMGWRQLDNPVIESLFGGSEMSDGSRILTGVNGSIIRVNAAADQIEKVDSPIEFTLGDAASSASGLVVVGANGIATIPSP